MTIHPFIGKECGKAVLTAVRLQNDNGAITIPTNELGNVIEHLKQLKEANEKQDKN